MALSPPSLHLSTAQQLDENPANHNEAGRQQDFSTTLLKEEEAPAPKHRLAPVLSPREDHANFQALCRGEQLLVSPPSRLHRHPHVLHYSSSLPSLTPTLSPSSASLLPPSTSHTTILPAK